jgi:hypothetical protein
MQSLPLPLARVYTRPRWASQIPKTRHHDPRPQETPRPGLLHRFGCELRQKDAMTLFYGHSVTRELVVRREPR